MVAGASIPIQHGWAGIWTELYHPKRGTCAGVGVAMRSGSDKWIDILQKIVGRRALSCERSAQQEK